MSQPWRHTRHPDEVQEALYPLRIEHFEIRADSAGAGEWRGGIGLEKVIAPLTSCRVHVLNERIGCPPWGVRGGGDAARPCITIERPGAPPEEVRKANIPVGPGDRIRVQTSGGGGYSDPLQRDPSKVAADVRLGYVSREAAERVYGVVLDQQGAVRPDETAERRTRRAAQR